MNGWRSLIQSYLYLAGDCSGDGFYQYSVVVRTVQPVLEELGPEYEEAQKRLVQRAGRVSAKWCCRNFSGAGGGRGAVVYS